MNSPQRTRRHTEENLNTLSGMIVDAAMKVHSALGPGLLENAYEICLKHELLKRGVEVKRQVELPVCYDGIQLDAGYRIDLLVADEIVVELKSVDKIVPIHEAQLLSYLKLSNLHVGLLINFNVIHLKDGIKRMVNRFQPLRSSASSAVK
ncbi:GxxExxY protein [Trichlorobacter lovleyi]|uniref:GxxExxY protein n=2 Tax=Trichlorobacter lovleyi TaxID=313985 RepID=UPI0023F3D5E0|nr:GxxExxY protein [Trichlorobacter lovleyi]